MDADLFLDKDSLVSLFHLANFLPEFLYDTGSMAETCQGPEIHYA